MWQEALKLAVNNGIWAVLFLCLLVYQLKDSREREKKYQQTIKSLNSSLSVVEKIEDDINAVQANVRKVSGSVAIVHKNVVKIKQDTQKILSTPVYEKK